MLSLADARVYVRVDPAHGGEVADLVDAETGRQLLARPPFASDLPRSGPLDEEAWTRSYRGGWQTVLPNAGAPCEVAGERHGWHGRASHEPWEVLDAGPQHAELCWRGHGLEARRALVVDDGALRVRTRLRSLGERVPFVALEHVAVGLELLDPELEIVLPSGVVAFESSDADGPLTTPDLAAPWPEIALRDGRRERGDRWPLERPRDRFAIVSGAPALAWAAVRNAGRGQGLALAWDGAFMPHAWIWHDVRGVGWLWRTRNEVLGLEPSTVPHSLGLRAAVEAGQARWVGPGDEVAWWIVARPFTAARAPRGVDGDARPLF